MLCRVDKCDQPIRKYKHCVEHYAILEIHSQKTATYRAWLSMKRRCYNSNTRNYKWYGGRGIKVCDKWNLTFVDFYLDIGERPDGMSLDRVNYNGNYEPGNCRWATWDVQCKNRRNPIPWTEERRQNHIVAYKKAWITRRNKDVPVKGQTRLFG